MQKIVLASGSANRQAVLKQARVAFEVFLARVNEQSVKETDSKKRAVKIAELKARWVAERKSGVIVAADLFDVCEGRILEKPKTKAEAREMLRFLSGKTFITYTGLFCVNTGNGKVFSDTAVTEVEFREIDDEEIDDSVENEPVTDWAAGFSLAHSSIKFVKRVNGSLSGLMYGLPLELLHEALRKVV